MGRRDWGYRSRRYQQVGRKGGEGGRDGGPEIWVRVSGSSDAVLGILPHLFFNFIYMLAYTL